MLIGGRPRAKEKRERRGKENIRLVGDKEHRKGGTKDQRRESFLTRSLIANSGETLLK